METIVAIFSYRRADKLKILKSQLAAAGIDKYIISVMVHEMRVKTHHVKRTGR